MSDSNLMPILDYYANKIKSMENNSIPNVVGKLRITFNNDYSLSIIRGRGTYGSAQDLFECAAFDSAGKWVCELIGSDYDDEPVGWQTLDDVESHMIKLANL